MKISSIIKEKISLNFTITIRKTTEKFCLSTSDRMSEMKLKWGNFKNVKFKDKTR